jgi:hypothetical protein
MDQNRKSRMKAERMRNRESSSGDLGSSSDRAMMTGRSSEARDESESSESSSSSSRMSSERGSGSSGERNSGGSSSRTGGITNRDLDREQCEQDKLPERGRSQSER